MFFISIAAQAKYYPLKIVNNTARTNKKVHPYIIFTVQDTTTAANYCVLKLKYDSVRKTQKASLIRITQNTDSRKYTYRLDSLQGYDSSTNSITLLIPNTISGRCMVSLNYKLYMPPVLSGNNINWVFQDPSVSNISDVNYDIIYDKFEFTYNKKNVMYIDPTAVDFFSIPISLSSSSAGSSGPSPNAKRDSLLKIVTRTLHNTPANKWDALIIKDSGTILRITAPNLAPSFDTSYLTQTSFNYIDTLIKYYQSHILRINCAELDVVGDEVFDKYGDTVSPAMDPGAYLFTSSYITNGLWIFTNSPKTGSPIIDTINMNIANSNNFFGPGTSPFITPNTTVISIIVKNITAAFTVSLLPAPDSMLLDSAYLSSSSYPYYQTDTLLNPPLGTGPWYNLYTQALHKAIPQIYAFAYDDVLGQSGTLVSSNNKDTISVTLGDMGNIVIPKHNSLLPVYACTLKYNSGFVHIGSNYIDTLKWTIPNGQPSNASYFFMGNGPGFTISPQQFITYQLGNFYASADSVGWVSIPDSLFGPCSNTMIPMTVYTCGGPSCFCPTDTSNWTWWTTAQGSNLLPAIDSIVYPVTVTSNSGFTKSGNNYTATINWTVPPGQPSTAQYFFMGSGTGFIISPDTFIYYQLNTAYTGQETTGVITIPTSVFNDTLTGPISIQVLTCGGPGHPCPTASNIKLWNCDEGSNIMAPAVGADIQQATKKRKKRK